MYLFITFTCLLLSMATAQHYNYPRPKAPFPLVSRDQAHRHYQVPRAINGPAQTFVVRTVGPNRHAYEVQMLKSQQLYEGRVSTTVQSNHLNYAPGPPSPPHQQYHHQQQQQQQQHYQQQSLPYTVNANPLIQGAPVSFAPPASAQASAYGPPNYTPPEPISYSSSATTQLASSPFPVSYGPPNSPPPPPASAPIAVGPPASLPPTSAHPNSPQHNAAGNQLIPIPPINPEPYAVVQLPNGAQVQDGGHGAGGHGAGGHHQSGDGSRTGDYHAQSQASQLDYYDYKQNPAGDARDYQRYITTCSPDGQCKRVAVSPGQAEPGHQQFLIDARAHTAPSQDNCKRFADARAAQEATSSGGSFRRSSSGGSGGKSADGSGPLGGQRPPNRRYFQYTETVLTRDPYN